MASQADLQFQLKLVDSMSGTLNQIKASLAGLGGAASETRNKLESLGEVAENIGEAIGGFFASFELASKALEASDALTQGMFRIQRAALIAKDGMDAFGESIEEALNKSGGRTTEAELLGIAESAAKIGVAKGDLSEFSAGIVKLGLNAGGMGDQYATAIGQILNVTESGTEGWKDYENELAAVAAATGVATGSLVTHARALASATAASYLSKEAVTALAAVTDGLPGRFNAAAGSLQNIFAAISTDSLRSREGLRQISLATGETVEKLQELAHTDPTAILTRIWERVRALDGQRLSQQNFLSQFNVQGGEAERVMTELAAKSDLFNRSLTTAQQARGKTDALNNPENQAPRSFANSVTDMTNALDELFATMGKLIAPQAIAFMDDLRDVLREVTTVLKGMGTTLGTVVTDIIVFGGALGGLYKTAQLVKEVFVSIGESLGLTALAEGTERIAAASTALKEAGAITAVTAGGTDAMIAGMSGVGGGALITGMSRAGQEAVTANSAAKAASGLTRVGEKALAAEASLGFMETVTAGLGGIFGTLGAAIMPVIAALAGYEVARVAVKAATGKDILPSIPDEVSNVGSHLARGATNLGNTLGLNGPAKENTSSDTHSTKQAILDLIGEIIQKGFLDDIHHAPEPEVATHENDESFGLNTGPTEDQARKRAEADKHDRATTLSTTDDQILAPALGIFNANKALTDYSATLQKVIDMSADDRAKHIGGAITDADVARMKEGLVLLQRQADPIANQIRLGEESLNMQRATTADLKTQVAIRNAINAAIEKDASITLPENAEKLKAVAAQEYEKQTVAANNAIAEQNQQLDEQIARLVTIGTAAQNALDIEIKRVAFDKANGAGTFASGGTELKETTVQTLTSLQNIHNQDQEVTATLKLRDTLKQIDDLRAHGLIQDDEAQGDRQRAIAQTLAQANPYGEIIQQSQREVEYASALGPLREAEIKALQTINQLKDQGVIKEGQNTAELKDALTTLNKDVAEYQKEMNSGFNGFVNKVGTIQDQISSLQTTAADTLSTGIADAITRTPFNFQQLGQSLAKQGANMLVSQLLQGTGLAGPDKAKQAQIQADLNKVQQIQEAHITILNADIKSDSDAAKKFGTNSGVDINKPIAPNPNTPNVKGIGGDATTNADGSPKTDVQKLTDAMNVHSSALPGPDTQSHIDTGAALLPNAANAGVPMTTQPVGSPFGVLDVPKQFDTAKSALRGIGGPPDNTPKTVATEPDPDIIKQGLVKNTAAGAPDYELTGAQHYLLEDALKKQGVKLPNPDLPAPGANPSSMLTPANNNNGFYVPVASDSGELWNQGEDAYSRSPMRRILPQIGGGDLSASTKPANGPLSDYYGLPANVRSQIENKRQYEEWQKQPGDQRDEGGDWKGNRLMPGSEYGSPPWTFGQPGHGFDEGWKTDSVNFSPPWNNTGAGGFDPSQLTAAQTQLTSALQTGANGVQTGTQMLTADLTNGAGGIQSALQNLIKSLLSSGSGGGGGGGLGGSLLSGLLGGGGGAAAGDVAGGSADVALQAADLAVVAHSGMLVGTTWGDGYRSLPSNLFAAARRYHAGLGHDEFPAILQKGERVLTQNQNSKAMAMLNHVTRDAPAGSWAANSNKSATIHQSFNISTPDANSFRASQGQINTRASLAMRRATDRNA